MNGEQSRSLYRAGVETRLAAKKKKKKKKKKERKSGGDEDDTGTTRWICVK